MVKLVAFFKRRAGLSVEAFQDHWRKRHAELVVRQSGLRRYVQNHTLASGYRGNEPVYDGVAEAWFDDIEGMRSIADSAEYKAVRADEENFIDPASMGALITHEVVIVEGPPAPPDVKMITYLNKRPDVTADFFQRHWREKHGPIAARIPGLRRYVQCHVHAGIYAAGRAPIFDGIPFSYFDDLGALRASGKSPEYAQTRADEENFMVSGRLPFVISEAIEIEVDG
jgi:uncharacterized protein (TIGR02118 family)